MQSETIFLPGAIPASSISTAENHSPCAESLAPTELIQVNGSAELVVDSSSAGFDTSAWCISDAGYETSHKSSAIWVFFHNAPPLNASRVWLGTALDLEPRAIKGMIKFDLGMKQELRAEVKQGLSPTRDQSGESNCSLDDRSTAETPTDYQEWQGSHMATSETANRSVSKQDYVVQKDGTILVLDDNPVDTPATADFTEICHNPMPPHPTDRVARRPPQSKRSLEESFSTGSASGSDCPAPEPKRRIIQKSHDPRAHLLLACPFYKQNRIKHQDCLGYQLKRIKDVKQHVYRKHSQPDLYCSRCYLVFNTPDARDRHTRPGDCEKGPARQFEGITAAQKKTLTQHVNRGRIVADQWFGMWDAIFPGQPRPDDVHVGSHSEEAVSLLRDCWKNWWEDITEDVLQGRLDAIGQDTVYSIMKAVFARFEERLTATPGDTEEQEVRGEDKFVEMPVDHWVAQDLSPIEQLLSLPTLSPTSSGVVTTPQTINPMAAAASNHLSTTFTPLDNSQSQGSIFISPDETLVELDSSPFFGSWELDEQWLYK